MVLSLSDNKLQPDPMMTQFTDTYRSTGLNRLTHWPPAVMHECSLKSINFKLISKINLDHFHWNCPHMNATRPHWWLVNIGSGNGLVPIGTKPLPEPMLTKFYGITQLQWFHRTATKVPNVSLVNSAEEINWNRPKHARLGNTCCSLHAWFDTVNSQLMLTSGTCSRHVN